MVIGVKQMPLREKFVFKSWNDCSPLIASKYSLKYIGFWEDRIFEKKPVIDGRDGRDN